MNWYSGAESPVISTDELTNRTQKTSFLSKFGRTNPQPSETSSVRSGSTTASMLGPLNAGELHNQYELGRY